MGQQKHAEGPQSVHSGHSFKPNENQENEVEVHEGYSNENADNMKYEENMEDEFF